MLLGLVGFSVSMLACGVVVSVGVRHLLAPMLVFVLFLLSRALFGLIGAASNPATQAYVAERTRWEDRTSAMASLAGAFGLGTILGPAIAPIFVQPFVGLAGPMFAFAIAAAAMLFVVWRFLPDDAGAHDPPPQAGRITPAPADKEPGLWIDTRLAPFLIYGFLIASCQTVQGQTLGFMIIDKLRLPPMEAQGFTAVAMMAGAIAGLLAQWGLISMFKMRPSALLQWGVAVAAGANLLTAFAPNYWTVVVGFAFSSLGYGLARPGFTAGASLSVRIDEQARAAGAIAAVNGSSVIVAPVLGVILYERIHAAPFLLNMAILLGLLAYALRNEVLRNAGEGPATEEDSTNAALERNEEGGPAV
jgi:MFS family permease